MAEPKQEESYDATEAKKLLVLYNWELKPDKSKVDQAAKRLMADLVALTTDMEGPTGIKKCESKGGGQQQEQERWRMATMNVWRNGIEEPLVTIKYDDGVFSLHRSLGGGQEVEHVHIMFDPVSGRFIASAKSELPDGGIERRSPLALIIESALEVARRPRNENK